MKRKITPEKIWNEWGWALSFASKKEFVKWFNRSQAELRRMGLIKK